MSHKLLPKAMRIDSTPASIKQVRIDLESYAKCVGLDEKSCQDIGLCVNEALANIIRHAYAGANDKPIHLTASPVDGGLRIQIRDWGNTRLGWEVGYGFTPMDFKDSTPLNVTFNRDVQAFSVGDLALPAAPYAGGPSGVGPQILDVATALPSETLAGTVTGTRQLDVNLHALRAGATLFWRFQPRWALSGSVGPALGLVPGSYIYNETFSLSDGSVSSESGKMSHTEVVFGGYAAATLHCRLIESADVYLGMQFMSLQDADFGDSQREASLDLGATFSLSLGVNWPF